MPVIHGRKPEALPGVLANCRGHFTGGELTWDLLEDGSWSISISRDGWMRVWDGKPELGPSAAMIRRLARG